MRLTRPAAVLMAAALLAPTLGSAALAQATHHAPGDAPAKGAGAAPGANANPNPVVATVNGDAVHLEDVRAAAQSLPEDMRNMPPGMLFPMIVNQVIDQRALLIAARKQGLQKDPVVQKVMQAAADTALQNVYLTRAITPDVTDAAVQDVYAKTIASKQGEKEVHARHILVATEAQANDVIKQLHGGGDFAKLAASMSTDKASAAQNGGDLGWFKQGDMLPEFSTAAFAMNKGDISQKPVHTRYGWHVIQVLDTRTATPPAFDTVKDQIRQKLIQQNVRAAVEKALVGVKVVRFKPDGSKVTAADQKAADQGAPGGTAPVPAQGAPATPGSAPNAD